MNKVILIILFAIAAMSCNDSLNKSTVENLPLPIKDSIVKTSLVDSCKVLLLTTDSFVKMGILKEMSTKEVNRHIKPLMAQFNSMYKRLDPFDTLIVRKFRIELISKTIDLQIKQTN